VDGLAESVFDPRQIYDEPAVHPLAGRGWIRTGHAVAGRLLFWKVHRGLIRVG
jgi:hypothetical protein